jgi:hypothetical protein
MKDGVWNSLFWNLAAKAKAAPPFDYGECNAAFKSRGTEATLRFMCSVEYLHLDRKPWASPPPVAAGVQCVVLKMAADNSGLALVVEEEGAEQESPEPDLEHNQ